MAYPIEPDLDYSYTGFQQSQGNNNFPGTQLDNDLEELDRSITEAINFIENCLRSDGNLQNGIVTVESLSQAVIDLIGTGGGGGGGGGGGSGIPSDSPPQMDGIA